MPKTNVWRKKTVRYVHAKSGKRTTRNDPKAVQRTELSKRFYGNLRRSNNTRKQIPLTQDKTTSLTLLQRLQREADKDRALGITIADRRRDEPIDDYLDAYAAVLRGRGRSTLHVTKTFKRASDVLHDAGTTSPATIIANKILKTVHRYHIVGKYDGGRRRVTKRSLETCNHYLRSVKAFSRWLWKTDILVTDPLKNVSLYTADVDRKKIRRALTAQELSILYETTLSAKCYGGKRWRLNGTQRALLYIIAACTGLRASELASLKRSAFTIDDFASVTIKAKHAKGKRSHALPLPKFIISPLRCRLDTLKPTDYVWPGTWAKEYQAGVFFKRDARRAGLAIANDDGETIDFHALRTSFITNLARGGVHPSVAQRLARHSTITLTMNTYTKLDDSVLRDAVELLPDITVAKQ